MTFEIAVGTRVRAVSVTRKGALLHVALDGRTVIVDARRVGEMELSLLVAPGEGAEPTQSVDAALAEYEVRGIRTTIPFFQWILDDADFKAARFDTTFIDRKMGAPGSGPLQVIEPAHEDLAVIAAAVHMFTRTAAAAAVSSEPVSIWKQAGRAEALR